MDVRLVQVTRQPRVNMLAEDDRPEVLAEYHGAVDEPRRYQHDRQRRRRCPDMPVADKSRTESGNREACDTEDDWQESGRDELHHEPEREEERHRDGVPPSIAHTRIR